MRNNRAAARSSHTEALPSWCAVNDFTAITGAEASTAFNCSRTEPRIAAAPAGAADRTKTFMVDARLPPDGR